MARKPNGGGSKRERVNLEEFVKVWTRASSIDEVAGALSITKQTVYATARKLRDRHVKLKDMNRRTIDVDALNRIIDDTKKDEE